MSDDKLFKRIGKLFDVGSLADAKVLIVGCGSGGGSLALQLVMSGIRNFTLIDKDVLEEENIIRHVCGSKLIGKRKVDALEQVLLDRNPSINIKKLDIDIMHFDGLEPEIKNSTIVALATDNEPSRYLVNDVCVRNKIPFVVARVFTRGIGGEVFSYRPESGGCLACLEKVLERSQYRDGIKEIDLVSEKERELMYGMEITEIKDSPGLNVDISFITAFHTRFILDGIATSLVERPKYMQLIPDNYIVWGNRPTHPFTKHFQIQRINLNSQEGCQVCSKEKK
ncbi:MAG TPA: HesA/MoeB/ThiF family protein [Candidatus Wunengus sp. YC60]|uniref:HesA/MoeB/ThiF family protein n=1 Tax=Candidatus Wunengus sp. YC60 TaxID=3367697 RepID=UPI004026398A